MMPSERESETLNLFASAEPACKQELAPGAFLLRGYALPQEAALLSGLGEVSSAAPFRHMLTPGGHRMSVAMTNCGGLGWVTDRSGYRYTAFEPDGGGRWPVMPAAFQVLARGAAEE